MQLLYRKIRSWVSRAFRSLAFLPVPMTFLALCLGFLLFYLERNTNLSGWFMTEIPALEIKSQDTARATLTLLIGGLITLMVFTFTQIMSLLNSVAASYSPRLLPWMTADRSLQFVMGFYLSSIVLNIIVLLSIRGDDEGTVANFSVLLCVLIGIVCLVLFLYFVTTISSRIQVSSIIKSVYERGGAAVKAVEQRDNFSEEPVPEDLTDWYVIPSPISGFVGSVNYAGLAELSEQYDTRFYLEVAKGHYLPANLPILRSERQLDDAQIEAALAAVSPIQTKFDDWYLPHLKLLTEIALKAMSPGINDPGTALDAIDRISGLLSRLMASPFHNAYRGEAGGEVFFHRDSYEDLLTAIMGELRTYCSNDPLVLRRLFQLLYNLRAEAGLAFSFESMLLTEIRALLADARRNLTNDHDRSVLARDIRHHRNALRRYLHGSRFATAEDFINEAGISGDKN